MRRTLLTVIVATSALTACTSDQPAVPTGLQSPMFSLANTCNPAGVRSTLATLHSDGVAKAYSIPTFNNAQSLDASTVEARQLYYDVINYVLGEYAANRLTTPARYQSTQAGVEFVVGSLYACAGITPPAELQDAIDDLGNVSAPNRTVCVADNALALQCRLPNGDVVMVAEEGFFISPAVIRIEPGEDSRFDNSYPGGRWSPVWRVHVDPIESQANYIPPVISSSASPRAAVAMCVVDRNNGEGGNIQHPENIASLQIAQANETDQSPPFLLNQVFVLNGIVLVDQLDCDEGSTDYALHHTSPFGSSRFAVQSWKAIRSFGSLLGDALTPQPLYAFDGGMGGEIELFLSYFAVVDPNQQPSVSFDNLDVYRNGQSIEGSTTFLQSGGSFVATAVPLNSSDEVPVPITNTSGFSCEWNGPESGLSIVLSASTLEATIQLTSTNTQYSGNVEVSCSDGVVSHAATFTVSNFVVIDG